MTLRNRHALPSPFSATSQTFFISVKCESEHTHAPPSYRKYASRSSRVLWHVERGCYPACFTVISDFVFGHMLQWCGQTSWLFQRQAETDGERQRVRVTKPISWEDYWSDHLFLPSSGSGSFLPTAGERGWVTKTGARIETEKETD